MANTEYYEFEKELKDKIRSMAEDDLRVNLLHFVDMMTPAVTRPLGQMLGVPPDL